ncbi:hypothetical protein, partial [Janthinobacterium sp. ROICE36]|uniref:hypothetical protein n=1 Tax=Janthinobacterium sp. ROICE36 TaxID=2048670 RepID=UPI0015E07E0D
FTEKRKDNQGRHRYQTLKSWLECRLSRQGLGLADLMLHAIALSRAVGCVDTKHYVNATIDYFWDDSATIKRVRRQLVAQ